MSKNEAVELMREGGKATRYEAIGVTSIDAIGRHYYVLETPDSVVAVDRETYDWLPVWAAEAGVEFDDAVPRD